MPKQHPSSFLSWSRWLAFLLPAMGSLSSPLLAQSLKYALMADFMPASDSLGRELPFPWVGGLNSAQIGRAEVNGDDQEDIVIYDRYARLVHTFIQTDTGLTWLPEYAAPILDRVESWALFEDMTGDGKPDLLTAHPFGIQVFAYEKDADGLVNWALFPTALNEGYLQAESPNGLVNIQVSRADVIGIRDADGDGDKDLWVFNFSTGTTINYYRNTSMETTGAPDALTFQRETNFWGGLSDCGCGSLGLDSVLCRPTAVEHAGGKSLTVLPLGIDAGPGILFGDELCDQPVWLDNLGNALAPDLEERLLADSLPGWQNLLFPSGYFLGDDTLVFSTNLSEDPLRTVDFSKSLYRYTRQNGRWQLEENRWLQQDMLDVGSEASPVWADLDQDGDPDLLVAQAGAGPGLHIWWNEGSTDQPQLVQGPTYLPAVGLQNWKVWVADLTGDGKPEIVLAGRNPTSVVSTFFYTELDENQVPIQWIPWTFSLFNGESMALGDIDRDGLLEAVVGLPAGRVRLMRNRGTNLVPEWEETESEFLGLGNDASRVFVRPVLGDVNADGNQDLLYTSQSGEAIWLSDINSPGVRSLQTLVDESGAALHFPANTQLSLISWELGKPAYLCMGMPGGGIQWYRPLSEGPTREYPVWQVYPNPTANRLSIRSEESAQYWLVTPTGKILEQGQLEAQAPVTMDLSSLPEGLYVVQLVWNDGRRQSRSVIKYP